jgi:hypothetical protein
MVFDALPDAEKVYWLNYLIRMEARYAKKVRRLERGSSPAMHERRRALLQEGNAFCQQFYAQIKEQLYPLVSKEALLDIEVLQYNYDSISPFSLGYLSRDWSEAQDHAEQQRIAEVIEQRLAELERLEGQETALFLGCGMGRYAVDLAPHYQRVEAFDASVVMIWCIEQLQRLDRWELLLKHEKNCRRIEETVERVEVAMTPAQKALIQEKIHFFVANANAVPLEAQSVDHLYSIYFTDVLPLARLYASVDRLLSGEGLFIHFGPLEYFFNNEKQMLTAEEVRLFFEAKGYRILTDEFMPSKHLSSAYSMRHRVYDNWFFIAQKPPATAWRTLTWQDALALSSGVQLSADAVVEDGRVVAVQHSIQRGATSYDLPEVIYELLGQVDGKTTLQALFEVLGLQEAHKDDQAQIFAILQELLDKGVLKV